jgi:acyl-CoA synthetase (AMP-forming)/AMP-acid ligase II
MACLFSDLRGHSAGWRDRPALVDGVRNLQLTYFDLTKLIDAFGALLDRAGVSAGDRITIVSESSFQQALIVIACLCNDVIANPLNPALSENQATEFVAHANPSLILTDTLSRKREYSCGRTVLLIDEALAGQSQIRRHNRAVSKGGLLIYTSGTTGTAKAVLLATENIEANALMAASVFGYKPGWTSACLLPLYHTFGLISDVLPLLLTGGKTVLLPSFDMRHAKAAVDAFRTYAVNSYSGPPIVFEAFLALKCLFDTRLRFAIAGAAPLCEVTRIEYEKCFGHPILPCYGLTEATCFATISPPTAIKPNSVGKSANIEISVRAEHGRKAAISETGEIALRGPSVIRNGYYRDSGRYANAFTHDGWFLTGDLGRIDDEGYVYVTGRKKNMVIRGGEKVYLEDVDQSLARHPAVTDSVSIVISEREKPDVAVSFVVSTQPRSGLREALVKHIHTNLGAKHIPDHIVFMETIPRSPTGKVKHMELRSLCEGLNDDDH